MSTKTLKPQERDVLETIAQLVNEEVNVSYRELASNSRDRTVSDARKLYCFFSCEQIYLPISQEKIGAFINRDHASVIHNRNQAINLQDDKFFSIAFNSLKQKITTKIAFDLNTKDVDSALDLIKGQIDLIKDWIKINQSSRYKASALKRLVSLEWDEKKLLQLKSK